MNRILLIVSLVISYSSFAQRGVVRLSAGPAFGGEYIGKNSGIYLLSVGPLLGKRISISPSAGYIRFRENANGFMPVGADVAIHSFQSGKKVVPLFILGAYFPFYLSKDDPMDIHGEFMGRLGIAGMTSLTKNTKLGISGNYMPLFYTRDEGWYDENSLNLRNIFSVSVEVMFMKLK